MSNLIYSPFSALNELHRELGRVFDYDREPATYESGNWTPHVDIKEDENAFLVLADIPGVEPKDIEVTLDKNVLSIRGDRSTESESDEKGYKRRERFTGSFIRQFTLPESADSAGITAKVNHGVLELHIPKAPKHKSLSITVEG